MQTTFTSASSISNQNALIFTLKGSVPSDNLPMRRYDVVKPERQKFDNSPDNGVKLELYDDLHSLPQYAVLIHSSLEFTVAIYNWLIKQDHPIYKELKRSVMYHSMCELVNIIEESSSCQGLPDIDALSVVVDPTSKVTTSGTILCHSIPKSLTSEQTHIDTSTVLQSVDCELIGTSLEEQQCKSSLAAWGPARNHLQHKIEADGIHIDEAVDKDILQIMSGQNLDATPHINFFWEQQVKLLKSNKLGRRYHPPVIRFALSLNAKSALAFLAQGLCTDMKHIVRLILFHRKFDIVSIDANFLENFFCSGSFFGSEGCCSSR
ncbi:Hypothetical predicted protein [Paramuricea clavata]|uniref:Uncharacterized protein n=1 Tax=Paramuricea clavata TaxID=317549 RepID=A0A6S7FM27_PARCT|nr:Hypothetical predicted protein [Paramuricea clavata]